MERKTHFEGSGDIGGRNASVIHELLQSASYKSPNEASVDFSLARIGIRLGTPHRFSILENFEWF